jgi:peptidylprolyl isomerase
MTGRLAKWLASISMVALLGFAFDVAHGQDGPTTDALSQQKTAAEKATQSGSTGTEPADPSAAGPPPEMPPEIVKAMEQAAAEFDRRRSELAKVLIDMRLTHTLYLNDEERNPSAAEKYRSLRNRARALMNQTFDAALALFRYRGDQPASTFLVTLIQHREERDIYDAATMEAGARLIDYANVRYVYVFLATARSAVVSGNFDLARRLYESLDYEKDLEDIDRRLMARGELIKQQYLREQEVLDKQAADVQLPLVKLVTTQGEVLLELFIDQAPSTVANFVKLVEDGFYEGLDFYQVVDHLLALTGDENNDGTGVPGKFIIDEHGRPDVRAPLRGSLVMAKMPIGDTGKFVANSASTQFAILYLPIPTVTEEQTVFGRVIEGMDVIGSLRRVDPNKKKEKGELILPPDRILSAEVIQRPEKMPEIIYAQPAMQMHEPGHQHGPQ